MLLQAMTPEMEEALGAPVAEISRLPFRVGRQPRARLTPVGILFLERHLRPRGVNQLDLTDDGPRLSISRRHFRIVNKSGLLYLEDLGSACGTIVDNCRVGGQGRGGRVALHHGSVIILGRSSSPYVLRFAVEEQSPVVRAMSQLSALHESGLLSEDTYENKLAQLQNWPSVS